MSKTERKSPEPKLPYEITNFDALQNAYPYLVTEEQIERTIVKVGHDSVVEKTTRKFVAKEDKPLLYQLVKLNHRMNHHTPGVTIGTGEEVE